VPKIIRKPVKGDLVKRLQDARLWVDSVGIKEEPDLHAKKIICRHYGVCVKHLENWMTIYEIRIPDIMIRPSGISLLAAFENFTIGARQ
jgi:hypothetical protein